MGASMRRLVLLCSAVAFVCAIGAADAQAQQQPVKQTGARQEAAQKPAAPTQDTRSRYKRDDTPAAVYDLILSAGSGIGSSGTPVAIANVATLDATTNMGVIHVADGSARPGCARQGVSLVEEVVGGEVFDQVADAALDGE